MSTSPTLTFYCPACSARLTVPSHFAGVAGPCPTCGTTIRAPYPSTTPPVPMPAAAPAPQYSPQSAAVPAPLPTYEQNPYPQTEPQSAGEHAPHLVRVEPRNYRQRQDGTEITARPITDQLLRESSEYRHPAPAQKRDSYRLKRILISLLALLIMAGVSVALVMYLSKGNKATPGSPTTREIIPYEPVPKPPDSLDRPKAPSPDQSAPQSAVDEPAPQPAIPAVAQKIPSGVVANEVLEKFLSAKDLTERLPLIDTTLSKEELQKTILASPMPSDPRISPDIQENNRAENWTDFFFNVELKDESGKYHPYLVLLRAHAGEQPKVLVSPFLDTYGGRLAAYASSPSEAPATFQIIASAVAKTTSDQKVPNHEQKLWLKLLPRDNEKEITGAFFTRGSRIGQMLTNDASGFRYGQAKPVKLSVRWNTEEDPNQPYLEAVDIKELRWSP